MKKMSRRQFVTAAASAAALPSFNIVKSRKDTIRVGLIGCGGRGRGAAENCMEASPDVRITAVGDMFESQIDGVVKQMGKNPKFEADKEHRFAGFDAYKKVIASDVDMVILATPPGFRPIHIAAAVDAGKHVFTEKPVGVDPVGIRKVIEAGKKAKEKGLSIVAGTQRRHEKSYIETIKRIHDGAIGDVVAGRVYWNGDRPWFRQRKPGMTDIEYQIYNWYQFDWVCGDHIVEQHVHNLDVMHWIMKEPPKTCVGVGGRAFYNGPDHGNIFDHFGLDFEFGNGVHWLSMCRHWPKSPGNVSEAVIGTKGNSNASRTITGPNAFNFKDKQTNPYVQEHIDLIQSIRKGEPHLNEAEQVAISTLIAIMGREAAYTGKIIKWDEFMKSDLDLSPPKYEPGPLPVRPAPQPGK